MLSKSRFVAGMAAALMIGAPASFAQPAQPNTVTVTRAWTHATSPDATTAAVYLTLTSAFADQLVNVTSPAAKTAQLQAMTLDGNAPRARAIVGGFDLPAGQPVSLQPNGYYLGLSGLKQPLKPGETVDLHLIFRKAPPVDVHAQVTPLGAVRAPRG